MRNFVVERRDEIDACQLSVPPVLCLSAVRLVFGIAVTDIYVVFYVTKVLRF